MNCDQEFIFHLPRWKTRAGTAIFEALRVHIWETESVYLALPPLLHRFSLPFSSVSLFLIGWRSTWALTVHFLQLRGSFLFSFCLSWIIAGLHQLVLWGPPLGMDGSGKICQSRGSSEQKGPLWGVSPIRQVEPGPGTTAALRRLWPWPKAEVVDPRRANGWRLSAGDTRSGMESHFGKEIWAAHLCAHTTLMFTVGSLDLTDTRLWWEFDYS